MCYKDHAPLELRNNTNEPNAIMLGLRGNTLCFIAELVETDSCAGPVGTKPL